MELAKLTLPLLADTSGLVEAQMREVFEGLRQVLEPLSRGVMEMWLPAIERAGLQMRGLAEALAQLDAVSWLPAGEREAAFRAYAARLNGGRRAWRKVRWTRLSEGERQRAALDWFARKRGLN